MENDISAAFFLREGVLRVSKAAMEEIGSPEFVQLLVNKDLTQLLMKSYDRSKHSLHISKRILEEASRGEFHYGTFLRRLGEELGWKYNFAYHVSGKFLSEYQAIIFDLTKAEAISTE